MTASLTRSLFVPLIASGLILVAPLAARAQETNAGEGNAAPETATISEAPPAAAPRTEAEYSAAVVAHINAVKMNTLALQQAGAVGTFRTGVQFTIGSDGRLVGSAVLESSGNIQHDNFAMLQIRAVEPFPLFAPDMGDEDRKYSIFIESTVEGPVTPAPEGAPENAPEATSEPQAE
ncbi:TonB C-terminal domain-containing protein [Pseudogemmobacter bohemicus]|uniref:TonB C-terminal domain-containing protein n=1 Tax=Pseudogemmobacter bohemicus TaxID=2250708 RepID=UPI000DD4E0EA|nr:TonB C-terminal domain-containing protein [Pseudogemmobacter bohemicus]